MSATLTAFAAIMLSATATATLFDFIESYVSDEFFWNPFYNAIDCFQPNEIKWTRSVSSASHGLLGIHTTTEALDVWVNDTERQTFFLNINCPEARSILEQANASKLFRSPFRWFLADSDAFEDVTAAENVTELQSKWYWEYLKTLNVLVDAEVHMTQRAENGSVLIVAGYKIWSGGDFLKEYIGEWTPETKLTLRTREITAIRRWDLRGVRFPGSLAAVEKDTVNHLEDMVDKHIDPIGKVGYALVKHLTEMINASLDMKVVDTWGIKVNGSWTGMVGDLESGIAEIGISPAFVLEDRMNVIKYFELITPTKSKFIFLSPPLTFSSNIFTMPFDRKVWVCCVAMVVVACLVLYLTTKLENKTRNKGETMNLVLFKEQEASDGLRDSLSDILMLNVGAICMQGAVVEPKGPSGRIIALFLYLSYMFLYVSYSGSIVALLQSSDTSIRTFKDLLESPLYVAAHDVNYNVYYFKTETEPIRKALYEKKVAPKDQKPHFVTAEEGIKNLRKGLYAFHVETSVGYYLIQKTFTEDEKCGLQEFKISFYQTVDPLLAMKIHSPYAEHMRVGMKRIIETGLDHRALSRIYIKKPQCASKGSRFVSVGLHDCYHAFMIIIYGNVLAWCILLTEKFTEKRMATLKKCFQNKRNELNVHD